MLWLAREKLFIRLIVWVSKNVNWCCLCCYLTLAIPEIIQLNLTQCHDRMSLYTFSLSLPIFIHTLKVATHWEIFVKIKAFWRNVKMLLFDQKFLKCVENKKVTASQSFLININETKDKNKKAHYWAQRKFIWNIKI